MGFFGEIGTIISNVGSSIMSGIKAVGSFLSDNILSPIMDFVKSIPSAIESGFNWVKDTVSSLFTGDSTAALQKASTETGLPITSPAGSASNFDTLGMNGGAGAFNVDTVNYLGSQPLGGAPTGIPTSGASVAAAAAPSGGLMTNPISGAPMTGTTAASDPSIFGKAVDFFKTPVGQFLGKAGMTMAAMQFQASQTKNAQKAAAAEQRRQSEMQRQNWLLQQQYASQLQAYGDTRQNQAAKATANNSWAGLSGIWQQPTTAVPAPSL